MSTISFNQFLKNAGGTAKDVQVVGKSSQLLEPTTPEQASQPNFFQRLGQDFANIGQKTASGINNTTVSGQGQDKQNVGTTVAQVATAPLEGAGAVIGEGIKSIGQFTGLDKPVNAFISFLADKITDDPSTLKALTKVNQYFDAHPEIATNLNSALTAGSFLAGEKPGNQAVDTIKNTAIDSTKSFSGAVERGIADVATTVGSKAGDALLPTIEAKTKTVLQETPAQKYDTYLTQGEKALKDPRAMTPLELAGERAKQTLGVLQEKLNASGEAITQGLNKFGTTPVGTIVKDAQTSLMQKLNSDLGGMIDAKGNVKDAPNRSLKFSDSGDKTLIKDTYSIFDRLKENPTLRQVDDAISNIQGKIYARKTLTAVPINTQVEATLKGIINDLNTKIQKIGGEDFTKNKSDYSRVKSIHNALNKALGADGNKGGALLKRFFSPSDSGVKKVFQSIKKETGIDLSHDAVTAKYIMDTLGDSRSRSLLEGNIPTSKSGVAGKIINNVIEKVAGNTIKKAGIKRGRNLTIK